MPSKNSKPKTRRKTGKRKRSVKKPKSAHHGPLTSISIEGFRGIKKLRIDGLAPLTVFTGDNGAGKSTLLEAAFAIYGRKSPGWMTALQVRRGLRAYSTGGPSYLGLFYGASETGRAVLSAEAEDKTGFRLDIKRITSGAQTVVLKEGVGDLSKIAEKTSSLGFRSYVNGKFEHESELIWKFIPPDRGELEARGAKSGYPLGMFQPPSEGLLDDDIHARHGDARETGRDRFAIEMVRSIDPRVDDVEYLQTTRAKYFLAKLNDGRTMPLGMLGAGVVNVFRFGIDLASVGDGFLAIDEVENGLYHRRLPMVFRALVEIRKKLGTQLMIATHSHEALSAIVDAATEHDASQFSVVHLRRDEDDSVQATVVAGKDARASLALGYDLR